MGEAKRRKLLDPNYGKVGYSYRAQQARANFPHVVLDTLSSLPTAASEYEDCVRTIVAEQRASLLACAIASKEENPGAMCLIVLGTPTATERLTLTFSEMMIATALWRRALRRMHKSDMMNVDEVFAAALSKLGPEQFLWTHLDIARSGIWARLIPVNDSDIALACRRDRAS